MNYNNHFSIKLRRIINIQNLKQKVSMQALDSKQNILIFVFLIPCWFQGLKS